MKMINLPTQDNDEEVEQQACIISSLNPRLDLLRTEDMRVRLKAITDDASYFDIECIETDTSAGTPSSEGR